jgi:hypothetical protein
MIKLKNIENKIELQLSVMGYQFPDNSEDELCLVNVVVIQDNDKFKVTDPALETTEVTRILEWFKCLSLHKLPRFSKLSFTEPCLEFEFLACNNGKVRISVNLSHEMKPSFEINQFNRQSNDWNIIFELCADDFKSIIDNIEAALLQYPIRDIS